MEKYHRSRKNSDVIQLAKATNGLTGSELEQLVIDSLHEAFSRRAEPMDLSIAMLLNDLVPLSKLMSEQIDALRKWTKGRARRAAAVESERSSRKIVAQQQRRACSLGRLSKPRSLPNPRSDRKQAGHSAKTETQVRIAALA